ncbi:2727_t:CDS:2 [Ambispora gerdemannii]|uniref:2727_t:CDS:1 n=1 Tax=Ambispora gerdemannii TaxID=144530 RepID=A0A9N8VC47_9GLOM|nr:2727_t:CDS:2 [Ambispora gerdemannii]
MTEPLQEIPNFSKLSPSVIRILGLNPGKLTLQGTNTYLIGTGPERILLDTGEGLPEYLSLLSQILKELGENIRISDILISHWHKDHIGGVEGIITYAEETLHHAPPTVHKNPDPQHDFAYRFPLHPITDNQIFKTQGATLRAIHTPGHTEDHTAFYLEEENALFTADCVLGQGTTIFSDLKTYLESLEKLIRISGSDKSNNMRIYPGHGPVVENGVKKLEEYILHRRQREKQILGIFENNNNDNGITPREIVEILYADYPEKVWLFAEQNVILHLRKLECDGKVIRPDGVENDDLESFRAFSRIMAELQHIMSLSIPFPSPRLAIIAARALSVDKELKSDEVTRTIHAKDEKLLVEFKCSSVRMLRVSVNSLMDMVIMVTRTMDVFDGWTPGKLDQ